MHLSPVTVSVIVTIGQTVICCGSIRAYTSEGSMGVKAVKGMGLTGRILAALARHPRASSDEVAMVCSCHPAYVRVVRQRHRLRQQRSSPEQPIARPADQLFADRRRRQEAYDRLSLTGRLMGDPCR